MTTCLQRDSKIPCWEPRFRFPSSCPQDLLQGSPASNTSNLNFVFAPSGGKSEELSGGGEDNEEDDEDFSRAVIYTQPFHGTEIMKALILAIRCGGSWPVSNDTNARGIGRWNLCSKRKASSGRIFPQQFDSRMIRFLTINTTRELNLWRDLGRGAKGRVFLSCNSQGKAEVKFYIILHHRQESPQQARDELSEMQVALAEETRKSTGFNTRKKI